VDQERLTQREAERAYAEALVGPREAGPERGSFTVFAHGELVVLDFGENEVRNVGFTPKVAREMAKLLRQVANQVEGKEGYRPRGPTRKKGRVKR
jgi:hypothetical protein